MAGQQAQQDAMRQQKKAQTQATAAAASQQRQSEMAINAANRRSPDVSSIMAGASKAAGVSGTMLTGPAGVDPNSLALGRSSLLGG
jgi:fatty acid desaturase